YNSKAIPIYKEILKSFEDINSRINLAAAYNAQSQRDLAYQELKTAIEKNPGNPKPYSVLGRYQELDGKYKEAEANYRKALDIDDKHAVSHFRLGRYLNSQKRPNKEGLEHLKKAVELEPEVPEYIEELGMEYKRIGELSDSVDMLERLSVLQPDREDLYILLGDMYTKIKFYQKAVERYWSALEFNDDNKHVHQSLRDIYQELIRIEEAKLKISF
ncbi:MAG: tetratricopeptide repeat protein, partial [Nitrospinales bacterium]